MSHGNTARQALEHGDDVLGKLCGSIASDESRHEIAYTRIVDELFRQVEARLGGGGVGGAQGRSWMSCSGRWGLGASRVF